MRAVLVAFLTVVAAAAGCTEKPTPDPARTDPVPLVHFHAGFRMFDGPTDVSFRHPVFDLQQTEFEKGHLHIYEPHPHQLHIEGPHNLTLVEFFGSLNVTLGEAEVQLDGEAHGGRIITNNATHEWQLWLDQCADGPDPWTRQAGLADYVPQQHDRLLIVFEDAGVDAEGLADRFVRVPTAANMAEDQRESCSDTA